MKKPVIFILAAIIVIGGGAAFLYMKNKETTNPTTSTSESSQSSNKAEAPQTGEPADNQATIEDFAYKPASITVKKGTTVTWTNKDSVGHTVTPDDSGAGFGSELLAEGESYSFKFDTVGTFSYHCKPHPQMTGTVIVTE